MKTFDADARPLDPRDLARAALIALVLVALCLVAERFEQLEHDLAEARAERTARP